MPNERGAASASVSRSALFVAACRALADDFPPGEVLVTDPYARALVDDQALAEAAADPPMQRLMQLRTRFIDDRIEAFVGAHPHAQVVLLGAGLDARSIRLDVAARFFEVDFPATLAYKHARLGDHVTRSTVVGADLRNERLTEVLPAAGFDAAAPAIVVWEGVTMYLDNAQIESVLDQLAALISTPGEVVADYVTRRTAEPRMLANTTSIGKQLRDGGEPLGRGPDDLPASLRRAGFVVVDDNPIEALASRYGLPDRGQHYPARILAAARATDTRTSV